MREQDGYNLNKMRRGKAKWKSKQRCLRNNIV